MKQTINAISEYEQQAIDFLKKHGIKFSAKFITYGRHFEDDKEERDIYRLSLSRQGKRFSVKFGQSINGIEKGETPTAYDMLTCLTKYNPYGFENFCSDFGYDLDSRKAEKIYKAVCKEWEKVNSFFSSEELEELQEIN
jgi:hypothetical protein